MGGRDISLANNQMRVGNRKTLALQFFHENQDLGFAHYQLSGPSWASSARFAVQAESLHKASHDAVEHFHVDESEGWWAQHSSPTFSGQRAANMAMAQRLARNPAKVFAVVIIRQRKIQHFDVASYLSYTGRRC